MPHPLDSPSSRAVASLIQRFTGSSPRVSMRYTTRLAPLARLTHRSGESRCTSVFTIADFAAILMRGIEVGRQGDEQMMREVIGAFHGSRKLDEALEDLRAEGIAAD